MKTKTATIPNVDDYKKTIKQIAIAKSRLRSLYGANAPYYMIQEIIDYLYELDNIEADEILAQYDRPQW